MSEARKIETVEDVRKWLDQIGYLAEKEDYETAHAEEDALYTAVLVAVAKGNPDSPNLARVVLMSAQIGFTRWHA